MSVARLCVSWRALLQTWYAHAQNSVCHYSFLFATQTQVAILKIW